MKKYVLNIYNMQSSIISEQRYTERIDCINDDALNEPHFNLSGIFKHIFIVVRWCVPHSVWPEEEREENGFSCFCIRISAQVLLDLPILTNWEITLLQRCVGSTAQPSKRNLA